MSFLRTVLSQSNSATGRWAGSYEALWQPRESSQPISLDSFELYQVRSLRIASG